MDLATILNPSSNKQLDHQRHSSSSLHSPPISPKRRHHGLPTTSSLIANMKPRSRFSALEDAIICQGVANGLTWGQISGKLPHRKRATCFNRYRTLQGVRKSRQQETLSSTSLYHYQQQQPYPYFLSPPPSTNTQWLPSPPPSSSPTTPIIDSVSLSIKDIRHQSTTSPLSIPSIFRDSRRASSNNNHYYPY